MSDPSDRLAAALADRYRIERELGQGGMATVYLARDLKHDRQVALKVLKPELAAVLGADRFVVEIKTTAALQHPHILPLFDSGEADGFLYYVMPFIDGETLRDKLNRETQLGIDEAVRIATEVAEALHYAHSQGVVHRDIKPENILMANGRPMVADFGIALALSAAAGGRMTETGMSLGTPHYMSPEQATADKEIGPRSDVYSLASVLFEMLTGEPPHTAGSAQAIIMKIIAETAAPVTKVRKSVPPNVAAAIGKALEKLPADRFESAKAFAEALANPGFTSMSATATTAAPTTVRGWLRSPLSWGAVALALAIGAAGFALIRQPPQTAKQQVYRAELPFLTRSDSGVGFGGLDISRDGSMIVYAAKPAGKGSKVALYLRRGEGREAVLMPGTEGARFPTFSPDGEFIAFVIVNSPSDRDIMRVPVGGGAPQPLVSDLKGALPPVFLRWGQDGYLYFRATDGISRVSLQNREPELVVEGLVTYPEPMPDGRHLVYVGINGVNVLDLGTRETTPLNLLANEARYSPTGHLVLAVDDHLEAIAFDAATGTAVGRPVRLRDQSTSGGRLQSLAISDAGTVAYTAFEGHDPNPQSKRLMLFDRTGQMQSLPLPRANYDVALFSPAGRRLAFNTEANESGFGAGLVPGLLTVYDMDLGATVPIVTTGVAQITAWFPGGERLAYFDLDPVGGTIAILSRAIDLPGPPDTLWVDTTDLSMGKGMMRVPLGFTPDGQMALIDEIVLPGGDHNLVVGRLRDGRWEIGPYLHAPWIETNGVLSPDGHWAAYQSTMEAANPADQLSGKIYAQSFPHPGARVAISHGLGRLPRWRADGRAVLYWQGNTLVETILEVDAESLRVTQRTDLITLPPGMAAPSDSWWDIHPDGERFVVPLADADTAVTTGPPSQSPLRLVRVVNWFEELKARMAEAEAQP